MDSFKVLVALVVTMLIGVVNAQPPFYTEKINSIPDLTQTDPEANFPSGGKEFCLHCAVTNTLMWLDSKGFPNLVDNSGDSFADQVNLAKLLASKTYMDTDPEEGTGTTNLIRGLKKYIADRGYKIESLQYQGWRPPGEDVADASTGINPGLGWIKRGIIGSGGVWLNVGWYKYDASVNEYKRIAGHWVTLVGYGKDPNDNLDPNILILHDPSSRSGIAFANEFVSVSLISSGILTGDFTGLPRKAAGLFKLTDGMHIKPPADCAIIDGAVVLKLASSSGSPVDEDQQVKSSPSEMFEQARGMLEGPDKDIGSARKILTELVAGDKVKLNEEERCYAYVYLGYIEDKSGSRNTAIGWFRKALQFNGPKLEGIRRVAQKGITSPVTWIRHLDEIDNSKLVSQAAPVAITGGIIERIGAGYITKDQPKDLPDLKKNLSKAEQLENFDILSQAIDRYYSFFEHKNIDWNDVIAKYRPRVQRAQNADEFYSIIHKLVRELKDAHSWLCNYSKSSLLSYSPEITIRKIKETSVVADVLANSQAYSQGVRRGSTIIEVDGLTVKDKVEQMRPLMRMFSSERGFLEDAYRRLLDGSKDSRVTLKFLTPDSNLPKTASLMRVNYRAGDLLAPSVNLQKGKFIWSGRADSGFGYIRILSFEGRQEIADEFDEALEKFKDAPGLIIDIRENPGGFGTSHSRIIGRLISTSAKVTVSYEKSGPGHSDFKSRESFIAPSGPWQYTKPVVLLINSVTGSASDLFACRLISTGRVVTIGTPTHGNSSGEEVYVVLPCGLVMRISNAYICDAKGRIIERNGNIPDIYAESSIQDIIAGRDAVLERAIIELDRLCGK